MARTSYVNATSLKLHPTQLFSCRYSSPRPVDRLSSTMPRGRSLAPTRDQPQASQRSGRLFMGRCFQCLAKYAAPANRQSGSNAPARTGKGECSTSTAARIAPATTTSVFLSPNRVLMKPCIRSPSPLQFSGCRAGPAPTRRDHRNQITPATSRRPAANDSQAIPAPRTCQNSKCQRPPRI